MTGRDLEHWARGRYPRLETLASEMGCALGTLYKWFKKPVLDPTLVLAFSAKGCPKAQEEARQVHRYAMAGT